MEIDIILRCGHTVICDAYPDRLTLWCAACRSMDVITTVDGLPHYG